MTKRIDEARKASESLLDDLENSKSSIDALLMKAKRLARLMRDSDAQLWLDFETRGYPSEFSFSELGSCQQYAVSGGRINLQTSGYWIQGLPGLEANVESDEAIINSLKTAKSPTAKVANFTEKRAT